MIDFDPTSDVPIDSAYENSKSKNSEDCGCPESNNSNSSGGNCSDPDGHPCQDGLSAYIHISYADDADGTNASKTPLISSSYIAFIGSNSPVYPQASQFLGLYQLMRIAYTGGNGIDISGNTVASTQWKDYASGIYYDTGNVGVGIQTTHNFSLYDKWYYDNSSAKVSHTTSKPADELNHIIRNTADTGYTSLFVANNMMRGIYITAYGSAYIQVANVDVADAVTVQAPKTNWVIGDTGYWNVWTGSSGSEVPNFRIGQSLTSTLNRMSFERGIQIGNWTSVTSLNYQVLSTDSFVYVHGGTGNVILPDPATLDSGHMVTIKKAIGSFALVTSLGGGNINGVSSYSISLNESVTFIKSALSDDWDIFSTSKDLSVAIAGGDLSGTYPNPTVVWANGYPTYDLRYLRLSGGTMTGFITLHSDPSSAMHAATKNYVDNAIAGLKFKVDCIAASTANVNIASAPASLDGVSGVSGDRWLLKNQTDPKENGIYIFNGTGSALTRSTDADVGSELASRTIPVKSGTVNADTWWTVIEDTITIGVTNIDLTQTAGAGTYTAGTGLTLLGNTFSITTNGVTNNLFRQSVGLSIVGRSTNSTGDVADIVAASDFQVFRRNGTSIGFGSIDISQSATVGSSVLQTGNGGTGMSGVGSNNTILGVNSTGSALEYKNLSVVVNRLAINHTTGNIQFDIAATYVGQTSITTLGTVTSGTWNATAVDATHGGTNQTVYVIGDLLQANSTTSLSRLAAVATGNVLLSGGVGVVSSWGKVNMTTHITGITPIANGGTGSSTQNFVDLTTTQTISTGTKIFNVAPQTTVDPSAANDLVRLSYLQAQLAIVSLTESTFSTDQTLTSSATSYMEFKFTATGKKVTMYAPASTNRAHAIRNIGDPVSGSEYDFDVYSSNGSTLLGTVRKGDTLYVVTQPSGLWITINPFTGWVYTGSNPDIYNQNQNGNVVIGATSVTAGYKLDVRGLQVIKTTSSSGFTGLDITHSGGSGFTFYTYSPSYVQAGVLDVPNTCFMGFGNSVTSMWIGNNKEFNIYYGSAGGGETKGFTIYQDKLGVGNFASGSALKSLIHLKGSLSLDKIRQLSSPTTILDTDLILWGANSANIDATFPAISSVGVGKVYIIKASPSAGSGGTITLKPDSGSGTERIEYGTAALSQFIIDEDNASVIAISNDSGSYFYWMII